MSVGSLLVPQEKKDSVQNNAYLGIILKHLLGRKSRHKLRYKKTRQTPDFKSVGSSLRLVV